MNPEDLNRYGFVNNFRTNSIECSGCHLVITCEALQLCDDVNALHRERSPLCRFVQASERNCRANRANRTSDTVGYLSQERPTQKVREAECTAHLRVTSPVISGAPLGRDTLLGATGGASGPVVSTGSAQGVSKLKLDQLPQREIAAGRIPAPHHRELASLHERILTFRRWTSNANREDFVSDMANAGFFYPNQDAGYVRCFYCNGAANIDRHCENGADALTDHIERHPECKFAQLLKQWRSVENESDQEESTGPPLSGIDVGLHRILRSRSPRQNQTESTDSTSVDDSSGEQTFWRPIVLCNMCQEPIRRGASLAQCYFCKKAYHRKCLQSAMRMRDVYHNQPRAECIDLHSNHARPPVQVTCQNDGGSSCVVVADNSNVQLAQHIIAQSNRSGHNQWTCADCRPIQSRATNTGTESTRPRNEVPHISLSRQNIRYTCPKCREAMNRYMRICSRCRDKLSDRRDRLWVSCNNCSRWYHSNCLTRKKRRAIYMPQMWICEICDPHSANSSSSSEDST